MDDIGNLVMKQDCCVPTCKNTMDITRKQLFTKEDRERMAKEVGWDIEFTTYKLVEPDEHGAIGYASIAAFCPEHQSGKDKLKGKE